MSTRMLTALLAMSAIGLAACGSSKSTRDAKPKPDSSKPAPPSAQTATDTKLDVVHAAEVMEACMAESADGTYDACDAEKLSSDSDYGKVFSEDRVSVTSHAEQSYSMFAVNPDARVTFTLSSDDGTRTRMCEPPDADGCRAGTWSEAK